MPEFAERQRQTDRSHLVSPAKPDRTTPRPAHAANPDLAQQQALGNQAVQRLAQSCPVFPSRCPFGGVCHTCPARVQAKLNINEPGDKYEQEADRVAEQVMRMPEPRLQRQVEPEDEEEETIQTKPLTDQITPLVQRQVEPEEEEEEEEPIQAKLADGAQVQRQEEAPEEEEEELIQTKQAGGPTPQVGPSQEAQIRSLRGSGRPLPKSARNFFEPRLGYDFSQVRVHTDARAAETTQALNARAYTVGRDIVFGAGRYAPGTTEGRRLLAHELTHVVQQRDQTGLQRKKRTRKPIPTPTWFPSAGAKKALEYAKALRKQTDPAIWFDSWGNDLRDNNLNGKIDDKKEQGIPDGAHYRRNYKAMICKNPSDTTTRCPAKDQSKIDVKYKVCIDIPIEAYKAAGVSVSTSRWIPTFFGSLSKNPAWKVWKKPARPRRLLAGDIVAAANPKHQHAGIVEKGFWTGIDWVINLPGPSAARKYRIFKPSGKNDIVSVPLILFESFLGIDWIARPKK